MNLTMRFYQGPDDMKLQYDFWRKVTRDLPWAWKPTRSPLIFHEQPTFDPRSRCFVFDGEELVGHMGFSGSEEFISLGYPWVLDGYQGDIQDEMFDKIYTFASNEYGGKMFAQRFRSQWKDQIDFFVGKGFEITGRSSIYGLDVKKRLTLQILHKEVKVENEFHFDSFLQAAVKKQTFQQEELAMLQEYYQSVDFDFSVACYEDEELSGYFGVTFREDNKYAEIIASVVDEEEDFIACLQSTVAKLRELGAEVVGIHESSLPDNARKEAGFVKISEDVMLMKKL